MQPSVRNLISALDQSEILVIHGSEYLDRSLIGIEYDSRKISSGKLFVALGGLHSDGHDYIQAALDRGACAILHEKPLSGNYPAAACVQVRNSRVAMSRLAAAFYGRASSSLVTIGVTGTEGKSTTVYLIYQLLNLAGLKTGFFSTVMSDTGQGEIPNPEHQTTPESTAVQRMLAEMRDSGCCCAVVEASSHGLSQRTARLADVDFDIAVMTNVTSEHLEFHGTWERYRSDKANLFRNLDAHDHRKNPPHPGWEGAKAIPSFAIVNADDPSAEYFGLSTGKPLLSFSVRGGRASIVAKNIRSDGRGSSFVIEGSRILLDAPPEAGRIEAEARIELPGQFNVGNSLAALAVASCVLDRPWTGLLELLPLLKPVKGRMNLVDLGQPFEVIIDYAHTPSSFEAILPPVRRRAEGRIFCLFGSGGERDREKRPRQAEVASRYCDVLILSDEDPRGEPPMELLEEIAAGCPQLERGSQLFLIPDRPRAIRHAFSMAKAGDTVLLLGKGHENSIIYADHIMPYDEEAEAVAALRELGYGH